MNTYEAIPILAQEVSRGIKGLSESSTTTQEYYKQCFKEEIEYLYRKQFGKCPKHIRASINDYIEENYGDN